MRAYLDVPVHVPATIANGRTPEGIDELRDGVQKLVAMLSEHSVQN